MRNRPPDNTTACPACGERNFPYAAFCIACGEPLWDESEGGRPLQDTPALPRSVTPESAPPVRSRNPAKAFSRWETWIGLALLLAALGYALFNWQRSTTQESSYREGITAAQARNWDKAAADFKSAGDHPGADVQEAAAQHYISVRDASYARALMAAGSNNWGAVISDLQKVQAIQPSFLDTAQRLHDATSRVFREGLSGLIYLSNGPAPGLYFRGTSGRSTRVEGSDEQSAVHALSPAGDAFVYDRQSQEADYLPNEPRGHNPIVPDPFGINKGERIPVLAIVDPQGNFTYRPLPQLNSEGSGVFTPGGLWWYNIAPDNGSSDYDVYYVGLQPASFPAVKQVSDISALRRVLATDPPRSRVIIAQGMKDSQGSISHTRLYIDEADGDNPRLLQDVASDIEEASVSPDGRWLLYNDNAGNVNTIWALPLTIMGRNQPKPSRLERLTWPSSVLGTPVFERLSASFVPPEGHHTRVLVSLTETNRDRFSNNDDVSTERLELHDLDAGTWSYIWMGDSDGAYWRSLSGFSHDGRYLASRRQAGDHANLEVVGLRDGRSLQSDVPLPAYDQQSANVRFSPRDDYVLATVIDTSTNGRGQLGRIYTAPLAADGTLQSAHVIATAAQSSYQMPTTALPGDGTLLAYVSATHELRAVFYDGSGDTAVAGNVAAVWCLGAPSDIQWWR